MIGEGGPHVEASGSDAPNLPREAAEIAIGLWQAAEALRILIEQAQMLGLPAPTAVNERLTFSAVRGFATYTGRYAEHVAHLAEDRAPGLVVASPGDLHRLLTSMRVGMDPPDDQ
jgi:hypothetical protein